MTIGREGTLKVKQGVVRSWHGTAFVAYFSPSFFHLCVKLSIELEKEGQLT